MTTDFDLTRYKALSFDCYGTLIDWEAGIAAVLSPWAREQGLDLTDEELLLAYADNGPAVERETPSALYPEVLATAFRRTADKLGRPVSEEWAQRLANSVPDWPAFPDSADALARLAKHYQLIILSNVHRAGFAGSNERLRGGFAAIITAEDVGASGRRPRPRPGFTLPARGPRQRPHIAQPVPRPRPGPAEGCHRKINPSRSAGWGATPRLPRISPTAQHPITFAMLISTLPPPRADGRSHGRNSTGIAQRNLLTSQRYGPRLVWAFIGAWTASSATTRHRQSATNGDRRGRRRHGPRRAESRAGGHRSTSIVDVDTGAGPVGDLAPLTN
jgi:putative hydrolase of the HAD superfamily